MDTVFPTSVIGSLPRPKWVIDLLIANQDGLIDDAALDDAFDKAITQAAKIPRERYA